MKKSLPIIFSTLFVIAISYNAFTFSSGSPNGKTGSPESSGTTCASSSCHSGPSASTETVTIVSDIPSTGFVENTDYTFTIDVQSPDPSISKIGFQASIEDAAGHAGTISSNDNLTAVSQNYLNHTSAGTSAASGFNSWSFTWNSGTAADGAVVYVAVNFSNGNGTTSGDIIFTEMETLSKDNGMGITEVRNANPLEVFPNPVEHIASVHDVLPTTKSLALFNLKGQKVKEFDTNSKISNDEWSIDFSDIASGNYLLVGDENQQIQVIKK